MASFDRAVGPLTVEQRGQLYRFLSELDIPIVLRCVEFRPCIHRYAVVKSMAGLPLYCYLWPGALLICDMFCTGHFSNVIPLEVKLMFPMKQCMANIIWQGIIYSCQFESEGNVPKHWGFNGNVVVSEVYCNQDDYSQATIVLRGRTEDRTFKFWITLRKNDLLCTSQFWKSSFYGREVTLANFDDVCHSHEVSEVHRQFRRNNAIAINGRRPARSPFGNNDEPTALL